MLKVRGSVGDRPAVRFRGTGFGIPRWTAALLALVLCASTPTSAFADEGGTKDSAGLVWSRSQKVETGSWWNWDQAYGNAANYAVSDVDPLGQSAFYDDWRLATVKELQRAIADGTMNTIVPRTPEGPYYYDILIWSADARGSSAWTVLVKRQDVSPWDVTGGGEATFRKKNSLYTEVFFVRGKPPLK